MSGTEYPEVETPFGRLRGDRRDGVTVFRRVPYAEAPVGPQRFEMPSAAPYWQGTRDATAPGPIPPQLPSRLDDVMGAYEAEQSEDCLHLDIWTSHKAGDRAPVLVFIHGGGFMTGGGSLPCYDGSILARENGLVVVTISYRLSILGFWQQPDFGGLNLALHDQVAAMRWIKTAIESFGGDPDRITVAGQSAGAFSIATHLGSDYGAGLFNRALLMSAPVGLKLRTPEQSRPINAAVLDVFGLGANDAEKLRAMPIAQILEGMRLLGQRPPAIKGDITPAFMPTLDNDLLPRNPVESIAMGTAKWCDVMIGTTREEFASWNVYNPALENMPADELRDLFRLELGDSADDAIDRIRSERAPATARTILGDLHTDGVFTEKSFAIAAAQTGFGHKTFSYIFDWQSPYPGMGACHCIDLPFLFGNIDVWTAAAPMIRGADDKEVRELSRIYRGAVAAFAASGDPNGTGLPRWPVYGSERVSLHFDRRVAAYSPAA